MGWEKWSIHPGLRRYIDYPKNRFGKRAYGGGGDFCPPGILMNTRYFDGEDHVGVVFIPMHFAEAASNLLTNDALDPRALIP